MQIKYGGGESRYIELLGIKELYNVVFYLIGEKVFILDFGEKFCVYRVLQIFIKLFFLYWYIKV